MTQVEFSFLLTGASFLCSKFAERYVRNKLFTDFVYDVSLNHSVDNPNLKGFDVYPEDNGKVVRGITDVEVIELLYRNGKVPVWIDISVLKSRKKLTTIGLLCAGRYSDNKNDFYYNRNGSGPFGIKSPILPPNFTEGRKFKL